MERSGCTCILPQRSPWLILSGRAGFQGEGRLFYVWNFKIIAFVTNSICQAVGYGSRRKRPSLLVLTNRYFRIPLCVAGQVCSLPDCMGGAVDLNAEQQILNSARYGYNLQPAAYRVILRRRKAAFIPIKLCPCGINQEKVPP